ncbi:MAG: nucleotide exchange factor GrpE [Prevotella sp.]|nr:nucleotide exchange factor GrpE [Prevotella sp.]
MSKFDELREEVKKLHEENIRLDTWISTQEKSNDNHISDICKDFIQVLEAFEWAEATIHERGLDQSKISTSAIARILTAKTKLLEVLESHGVKKVEFYNGVFDPAKGQIKGSVADSEKEDGTIASIVKEGFIRNGKLLRPAEVIVVKNE